MGDIIGPNWWILGMFYGLGNGMRSTLPSPVSVVVLQFYVKERLHPRTHAVIVGVKGPDYSQVMKSTHESAEHSGLGSWASGEESAVFLSSFLQLF